MTLEFVLLWGLIATLVLTGIMSVSQELGFSRMAIPFLLGTMMTPSRDRAPFLGFLGHVFIGWVFAVGYALVFSTLGRSGVLVGGALGLLHGVLVLVVAMPLLPGLHPRMASEHHGPEPTRDLEPPGFLALNYGRRTPLVALVAHLLYGAILGGIHPLAIS